MAFAIAQGSRIGVALGGSEMGSGIKGFRRKLPKAIRAALEKTFKYWLKTFAPHHFERRAFVRYPDFYQKSYKRTYRSDSRHKSHKILRSRIRRGDETDKPLVKTGQLKQKFLHGSYVFGGSNYTLKVKWPGLPDYAYKYKSGHLNKQLALTAVNMDEFESLVKFFDKALQEEIDKIDPATRTYGKAVF